MKNYPQRVGRRQPKDVTMQVDRIKYVLKGMCMMKKNRIVRAAVSIALVLMMLLAVSACGGGGDVLKGTWKGRSEDMEMTWTFDGKGGCKTENEYGMKDDGTYTIDGSDVTIKLSMWDSEIQYQFKMDGDHLTLTAYEDYRPNYELDKK